MNKLLKDGQMVELDVRWPGASLSFEPKRITTYPDPWQQVVIIMKFEGPQCEPAVGSAVPMLWLDLIYCGLSANACKNVSRESSRGSMEHLVSVHIILCVLIGLNNLTTYITDVCTSMLFFLL